MGTRDYVVTDLQKNSPDLKTKCYTGLEQTESNAIDGIDVTVYITPPVTLFWCLVGLPDHHHWQLRTWNVRFDKMV
jgi:hypothetical protein